MGTSLTGLTPATTYDALIKVTDNGSLSGTAKYLSDGLGNDSALALSTSNVGIGTSTPSAKLDVNGVSQITGDFAGTGQDPLLNFNNTDTSLTTSQILGSIDFSQSDPSGGGTGVVSRIRSLNESSFQGEAALTFWTGTAASLAERMRINSAGNVGIGTTSPVTKLQVISNDSSGLGVAASIIRQDGGSGNNGLIVDVTNTPGQYIADFRVANSSIVRVTSNGLTFNGDTAAANALDDYEEGTWTPVITDGTNDATMIAGNGGTYTKIGRQVTVNAYCRTTSLGSVSGNIFIKGLPFTSSSSLEGVSSSTFGYYTGMALGTAGYSVGGFVNTSATQITLTLNDTTGGTSSMQASEWSASGYVHLTITYFV